MNKIAEKLKELSLNVDRLKSTDEWKKWLTFSAKLHSYSFYNSMLIYLQCPEAKMIMPYGNKQGTTGWLSVGRQVQKGQKSIKILAPILVNDDESDGKKLVGFRWVHVFDVSQTEGEPVPEIEWPEATVCPEGLMNYLMVETCDKTSLAVSKSSKTDTTARGWLRRDSNEVWVSGELGEPAQVAVLLHELGHFYDPVLKADPGIYRETRADCELVAESVAWLAGTKAGIDVDDEVAYYLAAWSSKRDASELHELAGRISASFDKVNAILEGALNRHGEAVGV